MISTNKQQDIPILRKLGLDFDKLHPGSSGELAAVGNPEKTHEYSTDSIEQSFEIVDVLGHRCFAFIKGGAKKLLSIEDYSTGIKFAKLFSEQSYNAVDWMKSISDCIIQSFASQNNKSAELAVHGRRHRYTNKMQGLLGALEMVANSSTEDQYRSNIGFLNDMDGVSRDVVIRSILETVGCYNKVFSINMSTLPTFKAGVSYHDRVLVEDTIDNIMVNMSRHAYPNIVGGNVEIFWLSGLLCFTDFGPGMTDEKMELLGEVSFEGTSRSTGMGMVLLAQKILPEIGAKLVFFSKIGVGSSFVLQFPNDLFEDSNNKEPLKFPPMLNKILTNVLNDHWASLSEHQRLLAWKWYSGYLDRPLPTMFNGMDSLLLYFCL